MPFNHHGQFLLQGSDEDRQVIKVANFEEMGVGGLDAEFLQIFRRAFMTRMFPSSYMSERGLHHTRGMLMYGPPGCGKTLIARQLTKHLGNAAEPKIVNGPEILDKFVSLFQLQYFSFFFQCFNPA